MAHASEGWNARIEKPLIHGAMIPSKHLLRLRGARAARPLGWLGLSSGWPANLPGHD